MKKLFITLFIALSLILPCQGQADITKFGGFLPCTSDNGTLCTTPRYISTPGITVTTSATYSFLTASLPVFTDASKGLVSVTAVNAFTAIKQSATESATGVAELATVAEAIAGTDTSRITTPAGVAAATAILKNPLAFAQGVYVNVNNSYAGLVVDNTNIDMATNNFTLIWDGTMSSWSGYVTGDALIFFKRSGGGSNYYGYFFEINPAGYLRLSLYRNDTGIDLLSTVKVSTLVPDGTFPQIGGVITRETASTAGSVVFYVNGNQLGTAIPITAAATATIDSTADLYTGYLLGSLPTGAWIKQKNATVINRAYTAAEMLAHYRNGPNPADLVGMGVSGTSPASQTPQTSGTLVTGKRYSIDTYVAGDDFVNVGGANVSGTVFVATGTTPTTWTNSSSLRRVGITLWLPPEGIQRDGWKDWSGNGLNASYPTSGHSFLRPIRTDSAEGLLSVTNVSLAADADTTLYTVPVGKRLVLTKAILVVGADAGTSVISIGADGAETDWLPNNTLSALDAANDAAILQPVPNTTPVLIKSYAGGTVIQAKVSSHAGGATNSLSLFGYLY